MTVKTKIVRIGNSQGVRIPKSALAQSGLSGDLEMEVANGRIILHAPSHPRAGWEEAFTEMAQNGDDELLDSDTSTSSWDDEEWEW